MSTTIDNLAHAIARFGAIEVEPYRDDDISAVKRRFAFLRNGRWFVAGKGALLLSQTPAGNGTIGISVAMPSWWTPDQREAWRIEGADDVEYRTRQEAFAAMDHAGVASSVYRVTADLETGEETPA